MNRLTERRVFPLVFLFAALSPTISGADSKIAGTVVDDTNTPIAGATVSIYTARPRVGQSVTCPSCYRDCAKSTKTSTNGAFEISELDNSLDFRVLVAAPNRRSQLTEHIAPGALPIKVSLSPIPTDLPIERYLRGRVVDPTGSPIAGAIIDPFGAKTATKRWWGQMRGVDEIAISDAEGRFIVVSEKPMLGMDLQVNGRGFATTTTPLFDMDGSEHVVELRVGANVSGRLLYKKSPVGHRAIGIVQKDRSHLAFVGETTQQSDSNGEFHFFNLQANQEYVLYTLLDGDSPVVLRTTSLMTKGHDESTDLGDLELVKGLEFSGKVTFPGGVEIPEESTLRLGRNPAWDWTTVPIEPDGSFHVTGLPHEVYSIRVAVPRATIETSDFHYQITGDNTFGLNLRESRSGFRIPLQNR